MNEAGIIQGKHTVVVNEQTARSTYRLRFEAPELARRIKPGQFLMVRIPGRTDPLLGRAFALYQTVGSQVEIVYLVVGKMTGLMAALKVGEQIEAWGPLGNGFRSYAAADHLVLVAGGIGQTPFLALIRSVGASNANARVSLYYGARSAAYLAGIEDFTAAGASVQLATDDGTAGFKGFVTQLVERDFVAGKLGVRPQLAACGPEPMLHAIARVAEKHKLPCDVSLETPMACGVGICFSCVTPVKTADGWDYRRVCVDGPVFDAARLAWTTG